MTAVRGATPAPGRNALARYHVLHFYVGIVYGIGARSRYQTHFLFYNPLKTNVFTRE